MMRKKTISFALVILLALIPLGSVLAAWGGEPDGSQHPMVGAMYADFDGDGEISGFELLCSGSYAGPSIDGQYDVFLTAGHCVVVAPIFGFDTLYVSFDNDVLDADGPANLIASVGFDFDPGFGHDQGDLHDLGVVLLPAGSVTGIDPVQLPPAGYLDDLKAAGTLKDTPIELVGYGLVPFWQQPGGTQFDFTGLRLTADGTIKGLTQAWLLLNQNQNATGNGGLCFGDSGSPQFVAGTTMIVSTTTGGDANCRAHNYDYRLDTENARAFLGQYLDLP
jgi:hypothetical protein